MKKAFLITVLVLSSGLAFVAYGQEDDSADRVVVTAGEISVMASELDAALDSLPEEYRAYAVGPGRKAFAEDYLRMKRLAEAAREDGLDKDPAIKAEINLVIENTLASAKLDRMREEIEIAEDELEKLYEERASSFQEASARHILIAFEGSPAMPEGSEPLTDEEAKAKAEGLRQQLLDGADFATLAQAESHDLGSGQRGGNLGTFARGAMVPEFDAAVFENPVGEVGPVVRTQFGYHIIEVLTRTDRALEEVREELEAELQQSRLQASIEELEGDSEPVFDESYFGEDSSAAPAPEQGGAG